MNISSWPEQSLACVLDVNMLTDTRHEATGLKSARQTGLERQDLSRTYLAHHELESKFMIISRQALQPCCRDDDDDDDDVNDMQGDAVYHAHCP